MIVAAGEALIDLVEEPDGRYNPCLGGSVFNYAVALGLQGVPTAYLNALSTDVFGQRLAARLAQAGVTLACARRSPRPTALAVVTVDDSGAARYVFHLQQVADNDLGPGDLAGLLPDRAQVLHTGGLALLPANVELYRPLIALARLRGMAVSVDANLRPLAAGSALDAYREAVLAALAEADLVKVSEEDLAHLGFDAPDPLAAARALHRRIGPALLCLTLGAQGAWVLAGDTVLHQAAPAGLQVIDTVGAGDCFHAAFLAHLERSGCAMPRRGALPAADALRGALRHAVAAAGINVTRAGCQPPGWQETVAWAATLP